MSQQTELFQKALAAKLAGNEDGFKAAVREAIIAKTKALLGESLTGGSSGGSPEFYYEDVEVSEEDAQRLGLALGAGIYGVGGTLKILGYDAGYAGSRDEPGYGPEVEFEVEQGYIVDENGNEVQVGGADAQSLLSDDQISKLESQLIDQGERGRADSEAEARYVRRHGSLPDGY